MKPIIWGEERFEYVQQNNSKKRKAIEADNLIYTVGNEIHFTAGIDVLTIELVIKEITTLINKHDSDEKLTITYIVDSPGGCVTSVLKFVDFIRMAKERYPYVEFVSVITGLVASAGTIMCIVADKRYMTRNSHAMIHELSAGKMGKYTHLVSHTSFLTKLHDILVDIYLEKSQQQKERLIDLLKNETWFSAQQYKEFGFVDNIK